MIIQRLLKFHIAIIPAEKVSCYLAYLDNDAIAEIVISLSGDNLEHFNTIMDVSNNKWYFNRSGIAGTPNLAQVIVAMAADRQVSIPDKLRAAFESDPGWFGLDCTQASEAITEDRFSESAKATSLLSQVFAWMSSDAQPAIVTYEDQNPFHKMYLRFTQRLFKQGDRSEQLRDFDFIREKLDSLLTLEPEEVGAEAINAVANDTSRFESDERHLYTQYRAALFELDPTALISAYREFQDWLQSNAATPEKCSRRSFSLR